MSQNEEISNEELLKELEEFKPNYEFVKTREMTIKDFFNTLFVQFGHYRASQRIPRIDGLAETQRKVIWAAMKKKYRKKEKLTDVMSDISKISNYHHGPASLANVLNNLIAPYKNNLPFLKPEGSFGSRSIRSAAAERYTQTRNNEYLELMFPEEDIIATHGFRTIDGKPAEPLTLYPILPLGIINGQSQSSVGFATELLPRNPETILDLFIGILQGKVTSLPSHIEPKWPLCNSKVELEGDNSWRTYGRIKLEKKGRKTKIIINEVPHNWDGEKLIDTLNQLQESGLIDSYKDGTNDNKFYAEVIAPKLEKLDEDTIIKKLGLTSKASESFVYIDSTSTFVTDCKNIASYINYFITERLKVYEARKQYRLNKIIYELNKIVALINYINEVIAGNIEFRNKTEEEVIVQLESYGENYGFKPMTKTFHHINPEFAKFANIEKSYDYLFDFPIRNFTPKKIKSLQEKYQELHGIYTEISNKAAATLWLEDLLEFKNLMKKHNWNC